MSKLNIETISIILFISIMFLILIFALIKIFSVYKSEKRIEKFSMRSKKDDEISIADTLLNIIYKIIKSISKIASKSRVLKKYSQNFDKFISYNDYSNINSIDLISIKFSILLLIDSLYILTIFIKFTKFNLISFIIISILSFFILDIFVIALYNKHKKLLEEQLLQAVIIMNGAFKSGKNIYQAVEIVKRELPSPIKEEFEIIYKDINYGLDIEEVFNRFAKRVKIEEAKYITSSLSLLNKTGGSIVTVFNMIEQNFYDRLKIKNELKALTSSSSFLFRMLIVLPFIFVLLIYALDKSYFVPLIATPVGYILDSIIFVLYIIYVLIIKRIMKVDKV